MRKSLTSSAVALLLMPLIVWAQTQTFKASDGAVITYTPAVIVTAPPPGAAWFYFGGQSSFVQDFSYSVSVNYKDVNGAPLSGSNDIAVKISGQWGGFQPVFASNYAWPTTGYSKLTFALKPTIAGESFSTYFTGVGDVNLNCGVDIAKYGPAPTVGQWGTYTIPLADLCVSGKAVYKFAIQDKTGKTGQTFYLDNIGFVP